MFILSTNIEGTRKFLAPRTPQDVAERIGYSFTVEPSAAWSFPNEAQARAKARVLTRHMGWAADRIVVERCNS